MSDSNATPEFRTLVEQLLGPQTRRLARQKLVADAVEKTLTQEDRR